MVGKEAARGPLVFPRGGPLTPAKIEREREAYTECALQRTALMVQSVVRLDQINQNFTTEFNLEIVKYVVVDIHFSQGAPDLYVLNPIEF